MSTSLAEQLQRLAVPQTTRLLRDKKRPSLLFDPKEAANLDRDTVYEIGLSGLEELQKCNYLFKTFEHNLFNVTSKSFERSVENIEANEKLNEQIKKFLLLLSPYFLLKSAHKTLEWLVNRYQIHEYNKEEFIMLILPYHETNIYVRCLQLIEMRENDKWFWLKTKHGVHLPKSVLLNRCASDAYFLNFVCRSTLDHIRYHEKPALLTVVFNFHCTTIVGGLEHSETVNETQISQLLPCVVKGLSSQISDFVAASYVIVAKLVAKIQLSEKLLRRFVDKIAGVSIPSLHTEAALLLLIVYQSQHRFEAFPSKALQALTTNGTRWLPPVLEKLRASGSHVVQFLNALTKKAFGALLKDVDAAADVRAFVESLLNEVKLEDGFVEVIIGNLLELYDPKQHQSQQHVAWLENLLKLLENGNATAFDRTVQKHLKNTSSDPKRRKNLVRLLRLSVRSTNFDIVEKLYHPSAKFRTEAIGYLIKKIRTLSENDLELLKSSLVERLGDDDPRTVKETLDLCKEGGIVDLLDCEGFLDGLLRLTTKCSDKMLDNDDWKAVVTPLLAILCSETVRSKVNNDAKLYFTLLPFLFPVDQSCVCFVRQITQSSFVKSSDVFQRSMPSITDEMSTAEIGNLILSHGNFAKLNAEVVVPIFEQICLQEGDTLRKYLSVLVVTYLFPENSNRKHVFAASEIILNVLRQPQVKFVKTDASEDVRLFDQWNLMARNGSLPLQGILSCLQIFISHLSIKQISYDFMADNLINKFVITYFDYLLTNCANARLNKKSIFSDLLSLFLNKFCTTLDKKIEFLCNVAVCNNKYKSDALGLRCLRVLNEMLTAIDPVKSFKSENVPFVLIQTIMISLINQHAQIRQTAFDMIATIIVKFGVPKSVNVLHEIVSYKEEIVLDCEQLPLILYSILLKPEFDYNLKTFVECISDVKYPKYVTASMLTVMQHINNYQIFSQSSKTAFGVLQDYSDATTSEILYRNVLRFNGETAAEVQLNSNVWRFLEAVLNADENKLTNVTDKNVYPSTLLLNQIDKEAFGKLNENAQKELLNLIVTLASKTQNPDVISAINRAVKRIDLDVKHTRSILEAMRDVQSQKEIDSNRKRRVRVIPTVDVLDMLAWRKGVCVLEFLQDKKKLRNTVVVLPALFDILKKCLDFEEQASVEYPKQLLLSCILNCCNKMSDSEKEQSRTVFNIELVVQCVRASQNPQTHHHALFVLAQAASIIPQQLLFHIMSVFTFMGSSILRHDDAYSSQLISKIIDTVIPILIAERIPTVLRVFVDALLDIPEHRRLPLLHQLLTRLNPREYLWVFLVLVFESQVLHGNETKTKQPLAKVRGVEATEIVKKRLDIAADLARMFEPEIILESCIKLMDYVRNLPEEKDSAENCAASAATSCDTFNINQHTAKQFRHYKYVMVNFACQLLSSKEFVSQIAQLGDERMLAMEDLFKNLVVNILTFIGVVAKTADRNSNSPQSQYWKVMLHHSYDILDSVNALLTCQMFLLVVRALMVHHIATVRRRSLELLNSKLQYQSSFFDDHDDEELFSLLEPLLSIIKTVDSRITDTEQELIQQTALLSLKLIVRLKGSQYPDKFISILNFTTELVRSDKVQGNILASSVLCLAELCVNLRAHAISYLSKFMPALIKVMRNQRPANPDLLLLSVITAIQKIIDSLPLFLSPYLEKLLCELSIFTSKLDPKTDDQKLAPFLAKLGSIKQKLGSVVPTRVLLPALGNCYNSLIQKERYMCVGPLMEILSENLSHLQGTDVNGMLTDIQTFFLAALQFRSDKSSTLTIMDTNETEQHIIKAVSTFILKLSETSFRPIYYRLYDWAVRSDAKTERIITFYSFSRVIANNLKGLFVLFAGHFLNNAATLLDACNAIKNDELYFEDVAKNVLLLENILHTLHYVFLYDSQKFVNKDRFDTLMQPLVDQLDNALDSESGLTERAQRIITPCIVQFAVATADDALWKQMNYQILLKTRNSSSCVRLIALECLEEVTKKLGEDFLPLLPETIPFLAEMLEDEDEDVEKATQKAIQQMEKVLGEPLRKYF